MKASKKKIYIIRNFNNNNTIKKSWFGYLINIPYQLLTKKYKKKCRNKKVYKQVYNFPRKKGKGLYLIMTPNEKKEVFQEKKK